MMTRQEIFNTVYIGLRTQGFKQSRAAEAQLNLCLYRHGNMKCAFGHLIPDSVYHPVLEDKRARFLLSGLYITKLKHDMILSNENTKNELSIFEKFKEWSDSVISPHDHEFIEYLLKIHDSYHVPEAMKEHLENFGKKYNLKIPE